MTKVNWYVTDPITKDQWEVTPVIRFNKIGGMTCLQQLQRLVPRIDIPTQQNKLRWVGIPMVEESSANSSGISMTAEAI